ncbi:MAG: PD40 domain-containing protein, partial [Candidatus Marinimicrobia bacterium]|nr:PD40 domain-containing protein [Candidatus Neomarinimicrobiota bacterium]
TISSAIGKATGVNGDEVYENWKSELGEMYRSKTRLISENSVSGRMINDEGTANFFPSWSADGKQLAFISNKGNDYLSQTGLYSYSKGTGKIKKIASGVQSSPSWSPDGKKIVYGKMSKPDKRGSAYFDLYLYDTEKKKSERLTTGDRGRYPAYSPDGNSIAFVSTRDGESVIMHYDVTTEKVKELTRFDEIRQVYKLDWSPDGSVILFETSTNNGRDIAEINADGSGFRLILQTAADERHPVYSKDSKSIYFSSDRTGIFNIYSYERATAELKQRTNVTGGAFMPSVASDGTVAYSEYAINGYNIMLLEESKEIPTDHSVYVSGYMEELPIIDYDQNSSPEYESKKYETT